MPTAEYEIEIEDELWDSVVRASGISDPSTLANLALKEMLDRMKRERGDGPDEAP
jgi:Arc/MetJ family transcription regulator